MLSDLWPLIEGWPVSRAVRGSIRLYPALSALHIGGLGTLFGAVLVHHLALWRGQASAGAIALPVIRWALVVAVTSGIFLFLPRAGHYAGNPAFQIKLLLIAAACLNALVFHLWQGAPRRWLAALSLALWAGAILAGRWIAYSGM
jgi:hypothetical protein